MYVMSTAVAVAAPSSHEDMDLLAYFTCTFFFLQRLAFFSVLFRLAFLRPPDTLSPPPHPPNFQQHGIVLYVHGKNCKQPLNGTVPPLEQMDSRGLTTHKHIS